MQHGMHMARHAKCSFSPIQPPCRANFQPEQTNTILGPEWRLLHGEQWAWARLGGADVCFGPGSFMQVRAAGRELAAVFLSAAVHAASPTASAPPAVCAAPNAQVNFEQMDSALAAMQRHVPVGATITGRPRCTRCLAVTLLQPSQLPPFLPHAAPPIPRLPRAAADLHAGVGTIGLSLAATRAPRWVDFVEINAQGLPPFQQSAARLRQRWHLGEAHCSCSMAGSDSEEGEGSGGGGGKGAASGSEGAASSSEECSDDISRMAPPPALEYHVAAAGSDPARWCQGADVVIVDPPRKGLEPALLRWLCSPAAGDAGVRRLLYLSCGWHALQRDATALLESGHWRLSHAEGFLFFPGADHIETLTVWDAAGASGSSDWSLASD